MQTVKQKTIWLWQNAEKILIVIFFLTFTLNIRKVFLTPFSFLNGGFNEYMTFSISWADVLMFGVIFIYTIKHIIGQLSPAPSSVSSVNKLYNNNKNTLIINSTLNVSRETFILLLFLSWTGLSIFWSQYKPLSLYRFLTLVEIVAFGYVTIKSLLDTKLLKIAIIALIINALFQSLLGIAQFIHNGSLGLHFLGESIISPNIDGVAKILIYGGKHIRAYGTLPHPNILAGFLIVSLFLILAETALRKSKVSHETYLPAVPRSVLLASAVVISLGFFLTFSRSAWLAFILGLAIYAFWTRLWSHKYGLGVEHFGLIGLSGIILLVLTVTILLFHATSLLSDQSLQERHQYQIVSYETISSHPVAGVGMGQFVLNEYKNQPNLISWQYQPVHNIYLLIFSELGAIGLVFFLLYIIFMAIRIFQKGIIQNQYNLTYISFCIIVSFLFISLFDHYFWDIKLGIITFALPLIFSRLLGSK